jgi:hypothetical protein
MNWRPRHKIVPRALRPARDARARAAGSSYAARISFRSPDQGRSTSWGRVLTMGGRRPIYRGERTRDDISRTRLISSVEPGPVVRGRQLSYPAPPVEVTGPGSTLFAGVAQAASLSRGIERWCRCRLLVVAGVSAGRAGQPVHVRSCSHGRDLPAEPVRGPGYSLAGRVPGEERPADGP